METKSTISVPVDVDTPSKQKLNQAEDAINKLTVQYFGDEILPYLRIEGEIDHSGNIRNPVTELRTGFNTYCVRPIIMKGHRTEEIFDNITQKLENILSLTKEDLVPLTLCPLIGGELSQKERILKAINIVKQAKDVIPNVDIIEAVLYAMANKFLNDVDMNEIKESTMK